MSFNAIGTLPIFSDAITESFTNTITYYNGIYYAAFFCTGTGGSQTFIKVYKHESGVWSQLGANIECHLQTSDNTFVLKLEVNRSNGDLYLLWADNYSPDPWRLNLAVSKWNGTSWDSYFSTLADFSDFPHDFVVKDNGDVFCLALRDFAGGGDNKICVLKLSGGTFTNLTTATLISFLSETPTWRCNNFITLDGNDNPIISCKNVDDSTIRFFSYDGVSVWTEITNNFNTLFGAGWNVYAPISRGCLKEFNGKLYYTYSSEGQGKIGIAVLSGSVWSSLYEEDRSATKSISWISIDSIGHKIYYFTGSELRITDYKTVEVNVWNVVTSTMSLFDSSPITLADASGENQAGKAMIIGTSGTFDIMAYEKTSSTAINNFNVAPERNGVAVTSTIDLVELITRLFDSYFDENTDFSRVDIYYTHIDGRQSKKIKHRIVGSDLIGTTSWSTNARSGVWQKTKVTAYDTDGATKTINRADIGSNEDLTLA